MTAKFKVGDIVEADYASKCAEDGLRMIVTEVVDREEKGSERYMYTASCAEKKHEWTYHEKNLKFYDQLAPRLLSSVERKEAITLVRKINEGQKSAYAALLEALQRSNDEKTVVIPATDVRDILHTIELIGLKVFAADTILSTQGTEKNMAQNAPPTPGTIAA